MTLLMISFFLALSSKTLCNSGAAQIFNDTFMSLLSPEGFQFYEKFMAGNQKLNSFSLIELNDISKKMEQLESAKHFDNSSEVNDNGMWESLPSKKQHFVDNEEDIMALYFTKDYS